MKKARKEKYLLAGLDGEGTPDADNPEWTKEMFARSRPAREVLVEKMGETAAEQFLKENRRRIGRPEKAVKAKPVSIRLDPVVEAAYRATGKGWQTRINTVLREHMPYV